MSTLATKPVRPGTSEAMRLALEVIISATGGQCSNYTSGLGSCFKVGRTPAAEYGADRCCEACIAAAALWGVTSDPESEALEWDDPFTLTVDAVPRFGSLTVVDKLLPEWKEPGPRPEGFNPFCDCDERGELHCVCFETWREDERAD